MPNLLIVSNGGNQLLLKYENLNVGSPKFNAFISFPLYKNCTDWDKQFI
jgi:hypothetical protein